jgi:hypothetical protein
MKTYFLHNHTSSSRFVIHGGTTGKSCEGWMGHFLMGTHVTFASHHVLPYVVVPQESHVRNGWDLIQREPTFAFVSRRVLPYWMFHIVNMRGKDALHSKVECLRMDAIHAASWRIDTVSITNGTVCGRFHECWHERFDVICDFLQVR